MKGYLLYELMEETKPAMTVHAINYEALAEVLETEAPTLADKETLLLDELPYTWRTHSHDGAAGPTRLHRI